LKAKYLTLILGLLICVSFASALLTDADLYYTFDDADLVDDGNATDVTTNGYTGINYGATTGATGIINEAFDFDAVAEDYIAPAYNLPEDDYSVTGWYKPETERDMTLWTTHDDFGGADGMMFLFDEGENRIQIKTDNNWNMFSTNTDIWAVSSEWYHIVLTLDYSSKNASIYINGTYIESMTLTNQPSDTNYLNVGRQYIDDTTATHFNGIIDEFNVYPRILSPSEISQLYGGFQPYAEDTTPPIPDNSTWNNTGAIIGNQTIWRTDNSFYSITTDDTPTILVTVDDENSVGAISTLEANYSGMMADESATNCTRLTSTTFSCILPNAKALSEGRQDIFLSFKNSDGYEEAPGVSSSGALAIELDSTPPAVTLTSPADDSWSTSKTITHQVTIIEQAGEIVNASLYDDEGGWGFDSINSTCLNDSACQITKTYTLDGTYIWNFLAYDDRTNSGFAGANYTVKIDSQNPELTILSPANNSWSGSWTNFTFYYNDTNPNGAGCKLEINETAFYDEFYNESDLTNAGNNGINNTLIDGNYEWYLLCYDEAGNINSTYTYPGLYYLNVDSVDPTISFVDVTTNTSNLSQSYMVANVTGADDNFDTINITVYNYSTGDKVNSSSCASSPCFVNFTGAIDGLYYLNATINDSAGNVNFTETRIIGLDTTAPSCSLISITPGDIEANSTGNFEMIVNCTDDFGINLTQTGVHYNASFFTMTVDDNGSVANQWQIFYPDNDLAVSNGIISQQVLRAVGRNESYWYEDLGLTELDANIYDYAVYDGEYGHFQISDSGSNYATYNITGAVEDLVFKQSFPLNKENMHDEDKKEYLVNKNDGLMVLFYDLEAMKGSINYTLTAFGNFNYTGNPNKDFTIIYCNSSYVDDTCGGDFLTGCSLATQDDADNCVFLNSLDETEFDSRDFTRKNSSYVGDTYGIINGMIGGISATNISYIYYRSQSAVGSYTIRYANGYSGTNISFNNSGLAYFSTDDGDTYTQLGGTPDIFITERKDGDQFKIGGCTWDLLGNRFCDFAFVTDDIGSVNFPISSPNIQAYYNRINLDETDHTGADEDLNGTYSGNMTFHVNIAIDPDNVSTVNHSFYLTNLDGSINYTINKTFYSADDSDVHVVFDTTNVKSGYYRTNITAIADDDSSDIKSRLTFNNFTIDNDVPIFSNAVNTSIAFKRYQNFIANITLTDYSDLDYYIFSTNATGVWINDTAVDISGTEYNASTSKNITQPKGNNTCWYYWTNDTVGNSNSSNVNCFIINNTAPATSTIPNQIIGGRSKLSLSLTSFFSDIDGETLSYNTTLTNSSTFIYRIEGDQMNITSLIEAGSKTINITASDSETSITSNLFSITITVAGTGVPGGAGAGIVPPVIEEIGNFTYKEYVTFWIKKGETYNKYVEITSNFTVNVTADFECVGEICRVISIPASLKFGINETKKLNIKIRTSVDEEAEELIGSINFDNENITVHLIFYKSLPEAILEVLGSEVIIKSPTETGKDFITKYYKILIVLSLIAFAILFVILKYLIKINTGISLLLSGVLVILFDAIFIMVKIVF